MLKFKPFQREDLARAAMHDGAIIGWEPGLGKTFGTFAWPLIKQATRCLLVVPGGLHRQYHETAIRHFKTSLSAIKTQRDFFTYRLNKPPIFSRTGKTQFFIPTYQDLGMNGGDEWLDEITPAGIRHTPDDLVKKVPVMVRGASSDLRHRRLAWRGRRTRRHPVHRHPDVLPPDFHHEEFQSPCRHPGRVGHGKSMEPGIETASRLLRETLLRVPSGNHRQVNRAPHHAKGCD